MKELNRETTVFNDFINVVSDDDTPSRHSLQLSPWYDGNGEDLEFWDRQKKCAQATLNAYKSGSLENAGFTSIREDKDGNYIIELAVRATDIPDETWEVLKTNGQMDPCIYSGCYPAANMMMSGYRDVYGTIGRSWETTLCTWLRTDAVSKIADIKHTFDPYAAALATLKVYDAPGVDDAIAKIDGLTERIAALFPNEEGESHE